MTVSYVIQWNLYKTDTLGEIESVRLIEVFKFWASTWKIMKTGIIYHVVVTKGDKKRLLRTLKETKHVFFWFAIFFSRNFFQNSTTTYKNAVCVKRIHVKSKNCKICCRSPSYRGNFILKLTIRELKSVCFTECPSYSLCVL